MYWIHPDHLGGASILVNSGGKVTNWYEYMPYGEMLMELSNQDYNNPYKYNGKEFDAATGYYYYGARYYDPKRSFWLSVDPLAEITNSPYAYVWNDPVNFVDPTGMMGEKPGGKGGPDPNKIYDGGSIQEVIVKGKKTNLRTRLGQSLGLWGSSLRNSTAGDANNIIDNKGYQSVKGFALSMTDDVMGTDFRIKYGSNSQEYRNGVTAGHATSTVVSVLAMAEGGGDIEAGGAILASGEVATTSIVGSEYGIPAMALGGGLILKGTLQVAGATVVLKNTMNNAKSDMSANSRSSNSVAKPVNLPSSKKISIDMEHILSGHMEGGSRLNPGNRKTLFPKMSPDKLRTLIMNAYKSSKKIKTQGERVLLRGNNTEMWLNTKTRTIETAYLMPK